MLSRTGRWEERHGASSFIDAVFACEDSAAYKFGPLSAIEAEENVLDAWQYLVDTELVWQLQGSFGRMAKSLIEEGLLLLPNQTVSEYKEEER